MDAPLAQVDVSVVSNILKNLGRADIKSLAVDLGLDSTRINGYERPDVDDLRRTLVGDWINERDYVTERGGATWRTLLRSLKELGHNGIHKDIEEQIQSGKLVSPVIHTHPSQQLDVVPKTKSTFIITAQYGVTYQWQRNSIDIPGADSYKYSITHTTEEDEGEYVCVVGNYAGKVTSNTAKLTVLKPPTIEQSPGNMLNIVPGEKATLSVSASGLNLKYKWKKNGVTIPEATLTTYSILETTLVHEGEYICVISNDAGEVTSNVAMLTVLKLPVVINSPTDMVNVVPGQEITLSISASGFHLKYQWKKNGSNISGAASSSYSISETRVDDEGEYQCIVSNEAGPVTSSAAKLTVLKPPTIDTSPININSVVPGDTAMLSVSASGNNLKYQWKLNKEVISGATLSTYTIVKATANDEGVYECVVSNDAGQVTSDSAQLTLMKPPVVVKSPTNIINAIPRREVKLSVSANGINLKYQWKKDKKNISEANSSTYLIFKTAAKDEGEYQCVVSNAAGEVISDAAQLTVLKPPVIESSPSSLHNVVPGRETMLSVTARGDNLKYQWIKNGEGIPDATSSTYSISETATDDEGEYQCIVRNEAGEKTSNAAQLTLLKPPVIGNLPNNMTNVIPGKEVTLSISASGDHLKYQWKKSGKEISRATLNTYSILKTTIDDEGEYQCVVSNDAGAVTSDAIRLTVLKAPVISLHPSDITLSIAGKKVMLSVSARGHGLKYQWQKNSTEITEKTSNTFETLRFTEGDEGEYQCIVSNDITGETSCTLAILGISEKHEGNYRCIMSNEAGKATSALARLSILKAPIITEHPINLINIIPGKTAELSVHVSGFHLKYQWKRNGKDILHANSKIYMIPKTTAAEEGKYQCVVSNDAGAVISDPAQLTVLKPPVIDSSPMDMINAVPQKQATMSISASGSNLRYQWAKNAVAIPGATLSFFCIGPVITSDDEGEYHCTVSNDAGDVTSNTAKLTVLKPPVIDWHPTSLMNIVAGKQTTLSVSASGEGLKYQWHKDGRDISGETSSIYSLQHTTVDDEGEYHCVVRNGAGKVISDSAQLTVLKCPVIKKHQASMSDVVPGTKTVLSVSAEGSHLRYQWRKEAIPIPGAILSTYVITLTSKEHEGQYQCVVSNNAGEVTSNIAQLSLLKPPVITKSPTNMINIVPRTGVSLSVSANGQFLKYQWKKNAVSISEATSSTYSIPAVTSEDEGEYCCVVNNNVGDATSKTAKLTVLRPPCINKHPTNATNITAGKEVKLSISASGDNFKYQWLKNAVPIPKGTSSTYTILNISDKDEGDYKCVVSNDAGDVSSNVAQLTLLKRPVIMKHPENMSDVVPGSKKKLSISAYGHNLRYQWKKNAIPIKGATSSTYTIKSIADEEHRGEYRCVVSNDAGKVSSHGAQLTVLSPPVITEMIMDNTTDVVPGHQARFIISANGLNLKYQWQKNKNAIPGAFLNIYAIPKTKAEDEGEYQCVVSNDAGEKLSDIIKLTVLKCPVINKSPTDMMNIAPGKEVTLSVSASGVNLKYQWKKNGKNISEETSTTYTILNLKKEDEGEYKCVVSNDAGKVPSDVAQLTLMRPPIIIKSPTDTMNVLPGKEETLLVSARGQSLRYQWKKNSAPIPGAVLKTYTISNISVGDEGRYQCVVSNDAGKMTSKYAQLTVLKPPVVTYNPDAMISAFIHRQAKLSISVEGHGLTYQWQKNKIDITGETSHSYTIIDASEEDEGEYQCVVSNDAGSVTSKTTKLSVLKRPAVSIHVIANNQAVLSVSNCSSYGSFTYQWKKDNAKIEGATSREYSISKVTEDHEGEYQCIVTKSDDESVISSTAELLLLHAPSISSQPSNVENIESGKTTTLSVCASGIGLKYQWRKNSENLLGETSSTHTIKNITEEDEGEYQCVVSNDAGHVISDKAKLTMTKPPKILTHPTDEEDVTPGSLVTLSVTASGHGIKYQWQQNARDIPGETSNKLIIVDIMESDQGEYRCEVSNEVDKKLSNSAAVTLCTELQIHYILCHELYSAHVEEKVIKDLNPLSTTMEDLYKCICEEIDVKEGDTIEIFSHEGYPLHANAHTQNCKLQQWRVSMNELFYVFIRKVDQPGLPSAHPEKSAHNDDKDVLHVRSTRFGSLTIKTNLDNNNADDIIQKVASAIYMPTHCISLFSRQDKMLQSDEKLKSGDVLTLVLKSPYQCSDPQGTEYGKETYNPTVPQTDKGISKFFSILKFICSKKRDDMYRSRLLSYLLQLTHCPPMVYALKLLCENSELTLPCWVALIEGCYQLFRGFLSESSTDFKDEEVFEFSDYFWGLIIHKSQTCVNNIEYVKQTLVCPISKLRMSLPVTLPSSDDVYDRRSVNESETMSVNSSVLRLLTYHPWDEEAHVIKGGFPELKTGCIPEVLLPCSWIDLKNHLIFLPICQPNYLIEECLTFTPGGYLVYFGGNFSTGGMHDRRRRVVYDPVKCKNLDYTDEMIESAKEDSSFLHVIKDITGLSEAKRVKREPEEAIMVLLDGSQSMQECFDGSLRMDAAKNFLEAFVMTSLTYKFHPLMAVYLYGDELEKLHNLTMLDESTLEDFKKNVISKAHMLGKQTALYQAVEKAKDKLMKYTKKTCRRRILCLGGSNHNKKSILHLPFDIKHLKKQLKDRRVVVDTIEFAEFESPEGSLRALAKATGGTRFCPKDNSNLLDLHALLTNKHRTIPTLLPTESSPALLDERKPSWSPRNLHSITEPATSPPGSATSSPHGLATSLAYRPATSLSYGPAALPHGPAMYTSLPHKPAPSLPSGQATSLPHGPAAVKLMPHDTITAIYPEIPKTKDPEHPIKKSPRWSYPY